MTVDDGPLHEVSGSHDSRSIKIYWDIYTEWFFYRLLALMTLAVEAPWNNIYLPYGLAGDDITVYFSSTVIVTKSWSNISPTVLPRVTIFYSLIGKRLPHKPAGPEDYNSQDNWFRAATNWNSITGIAIKSHQLWHWDRRCCRWQQIIMWLSGHILKQLYALHDKEWESTESKDATTMTLTSQ